MAVEVDERWLFRRRGAAALAASPHAINEAADAVTNDHAKELQTHAGFFRQVPASVASAPSVVPVSPTSPRPVLRRPTFEAYPAEAKLAPSTVKRWTGTDQPRFEPIELGPTVRLGDAIERVIDPDATDITDAEWQRRTDLEQATYRASGITTGRTDGGLSDHGVTVLVVRDARSRLAT